MRPHTFFVLVLRVLGIALIYHVFLSIITFLGFFLSWFTQIDTSGGLVMLLSSLLPAAILIGGCYLLIFRADALVSYFKFDRGLTEQRFDLSNSAENIYRISIIVTGAVILFIELPRFIGGVYGLLIQPNSEFGGSYKSDWTPAITSGVTVILAFLLIGERERVLEVLMRTRVEEKRPEDSKSEDIFPV